MKKAQAALVACAFIFMFQMKAQAQQPFSNAYDYNQQLQFAFNVIALVDSKYLTLSSSLDYFGNFDRCALLTWYSNDVLDSQKCLLNTGNEIYIGEPGSFQEDARGGYFFGGSTNRVYDTMYYLSYGMLIRYNGQGDTLFTRTYGDSSKWQAFYGSSQTQDSGYVMIGLQSDTVNYDNNYFVIKSDKNGTMLWQQTYGGIEDNNGTRIYELENHNLILAGVKYFGNNLYYPWLVITDSAGNLIFEKQFYGSYDCGGTRITPPTLDDHIIMWGCLDTVIHPGYYPYPNFIAKLDSNLNVLWRTIYSIPNELDIWFVRQLADSSFILVGEAVDSTFTEKGWIAKVDKNGNKQWEHLYQYGSSFFNEFRDAQQTSDGGYIVCGGTLNAQNNQDIWLVKLGSNGCLVPGCVINTGTVEIVDQMQLQLFPNPASDYCTITFDIPPRENKVTLTVFDLQGRELVKEKLSSSDHQLELPLQNFATGLYVIELRTDNYFINKKLLKQ